MSIENVRPPVGKRRDSRSGPRAKGAKSIVLTVWHEAPALTERQMKRIQRAMNVQAGARALTDPEECPWAGESEADPDYHSDPHRRMNPHTGLRGRFVSQWRIPLRDCQDAQTVGRALVERLAEDKVKASWTWGSGQVYEPTGQGDPKRFKGPTVRVSYRDPTDPRKTLPQAKGGVPVELVNGSPVSAAMVFSTVDSFTVDDNTAIAIQVSAAMDRSGLLGATMHAKYETLLTDAMSMPNGEEKLAMLFLMDSIGRGIGLDPYPVESLYEMAGLDVPEPSSKELTPAEKGLRTRMERHYQSLRVGKHGAELETLIKNLGIKM